MKKFLLPLALIFISSAYSASCPELKGRYYCVFSDGEGSRLTVDQWPDPVTDRVMNYTFSYIDDNPYVEPIKFSDIGMMGPYGWMNLCKRGELISYRPGMSQISKMYLEDGRLIRESNGQVAMRCGRL